MQGARAQITRDWNGKGGKALISVLRLRYKGNSFSVEATQVLIIRSMAGL